MSTKVPHFRLNEHGWSFHNGRGACLLFTSNLVPTATGHITLGELRNLMAERDNYKIGKSTEGYVFALYNHDGKVVASGSRVKSNGTISKRIAVCIEHAQSAELWVDTARPLEDALSDDGPESTEKFEINIETVSTEETLEPAANVVQVESIAMINDVVQITADSNFHGLVLGTHATVVDVIPKGEGEGNDLIIEAFTHYSKNPKNTTYNRGRHAVKLSDIIKVGRMANVMTADQVLKKYGVVVV